MVRKALMLYMPVVHKGYIEFLKRHADAHLVLLIPAHSAAGVGEDLQYLRKDSIREVPTEVLHSVIRTVVPEADIATLTIPITREVLRGCDSIVAPDEDVSRDVAMHMPGVAVQYESIFLRYDRSRVHAEEDALSIAATTISPSEYERQMFSQVTLSAKRSMDWFRQVGAVLAKDGKLLLYAHNLHQPHEQWPYAFGDPRALLKSGTLLHLATAQHAESLLIGEAARRGIATKGADLFINYFPCGPCMMHLGSAGIQRVFYQRGSYGLNTPEVMECFGIQAIRVCNV